MTAFVRVLKDPTGVLWHNFVKCVLDLAAAARAMRRRLTRLTFCAATTRSSLPATSASKTKARRAT